MGASCGKRSARRLLLLTAVAAVGSLALSAPAFAQGGLGSLTSAVLPSTGTSLDQAVDGNLAAAAPVLDAASPVSDTAAPVLDAAAPVVAAADPVVETTTAPVLQAAAPVLETAAPVLEATAPVVQTAAPVLEATAPVVQTVTIAATPVTQPVSDLAASTLGTVDEVVQTTEPPPAGTAPARGDASATAPDSTDVEATQTVTAGVGDAGSPVAVEQVGSLRSAGSVAAPSRGPDVRRHLGGSTTRPQSPSFTIAAVDPWSSAADPSGGGSATSVKRPGTPSRHGPSVPSAPSSISAGSFGGAALLVLAALAAFLLPAAPGMSRRLRLMLALPPLPVALLPLERPG